MQQSEAPGAPQGAPPPAIEGDAGCATRSQASERQEESGDRGLTQSHATPGTDGPATDSVAQPAAPKAARARDQKRQSWPRWARKLARMRADGHTQAECATALGKSRKAVRYMQARPGFETLLADSAAGARVRAAAGVAEASPAAVELLERVVREANDGTRPTDAEAIRAAHLLLDRSVAKPIAKQQAPEPEQKGPSTSLLEAIAEAARSVPLDAARKMTDSTDPTTRRAGVLLTLQKGLALTDDDVRAQLRIAQNDLARQRVMARLIGDGIATIEQVARVAAETPLPPAELVPSSSVPPTIDATPPRPTSPRALPPTATFEPVDAHMRPPRMPPRTRGGW